MDGGVLTIEDNGALALDSINELTKAVEPDASVVELDAEKNVQSAADCCRDNCLDGDSGGHVKREIFGIASAGIRFAAALLFGGGVWGFLGLPSQSGLG